MGERGIEVRFPVEFHMEVINQIKKFSISSVNLDTDTLRDTSAAPSLVLRCMGPEETAWDLAKAYNSTIAGILSANRIAEEAEIPRETLLLIPRKRA